MPNFLLKRGIKWVHHKEFDLNKHTNNRSKGLVLKVDLECPRELPELHYDYPLAPDKIKIKKNAF